MCFSIVIFSLLFLSSTYIVPPNITTLPVCVTTATETTCTCHASGDPQPSFYWTKHGSTAVVANGSSLTLPKDQANDGIYLCHAVNAGSSVQSPASVAVFGTIFLLQFK